MEISVIIPVYKVTKNAIGNLPQVIESLRDKYKDFELLFIIDNIDVDKEIQELVALTDKYREVKTHNLKKNYGQHFATLCGYFLAKGDFIVCIDEDMIKYLSEICKKEDYKNFDAYYFYYDKNTMYNSTTRKLFSSIYKYLINLIVNQNIHSTFRIISKELRNRLLYDKHIFWNLDVMIFKSTDNIGTTPLFLMDISDNDTAYNYSKLNRLAFEIVYENNYLFLNIMLAIIPAVLFYTITKYIATAGIIFLFLFTLLQIHFIFKKRITDETNQKIRNALKN